MKTIFPDYFNIFSYSLYLNQLISTAAHADFFTVAKLDRPIDMRTQTLKFVRAGCTIAGKQRPRKTKLFVNKVIARLINGHRISGYQKADVGNDRRIARLLIILDLSVTKSGQYPDHRNARS